MSQLTDKHLIHPETEPARISPRLPLLERIFIFFGVVAPFAGFVAACVMFWGRGFGWMHLAILVGGYVLTAGSITIGYHRLFTHRAFETTRPIKCILAILGSMSVQGPLIKWVAEHRRHHHHSDQEHDPHSPHCYGEGVVGIAKGLWHSHVGWIFMPDAPGLSKYVADLVQDPLTRRLSKLFPLWAILGLVIPAAIGGFYTGTWTGALLGFFWGGLARIFVVHHATWSINSVCHVWGTRPYASDDHSCNNAIFGILCLGEGWHNNHHAFPTSARHGLRWWEFDLSYCVIRTLELLGLARQVRLPTTHAMEHKRRAAA